MHVGLHLPDRFIHRCLPPKSRCAEPRALRPLNPPAIRVDHRHPASRPQVSFSDLAMAEYAAARVAASKPPPLPERLVRRHPPAVRSWRMAVLRYNAWRRASTVAKRQCDACGRLRVPFCSATVTVRFRPRDTPDYLCHGRTQCDR